MRANRSLTALALSATLLGALTLASCGNDNSESAETTTTLAAPDGSAAACDAANLPTKTAGKLTVATGEPVFDPWISDDKPEDGKGYEAALVYAIAGQLGYDKADVTWVRTGFDEAISAAPKDYDFNIQQYSISDERKKAVDFSDAYYTVEQALVAAKDSKLISATSLADLKGAKLGAAAGSTSLTYIDDYIKPTTKAAVYDDNAAAKAAFDAGQIDGLVFDLPTAYYITAAEIPDATIVGTLPVQGSPEELGMLFPKGSKLVPCINQALDNVKADGTLEKLDDEYLKAGGNLPALTK